MHHSKLPCQSFRRFQLNFDSSAAAAQFTESIQAVCPCQPNAPASANAPLRKNITAMPSTFAPTRPGSIPGITTQASILARSQSAASFASLQSSSPAPSTIQHQAQPRLSSRTLPTIPLAQSSSDVDMDLPSSSSDAYFTARSSPAPRLRRLVTGRPQVGADPSSQEATQASSPPIDSSQILPPSQLTLPPSSLESASSRLMPPPPPPPSRPRSVTRGNSPMREDPVIAPLASLPTSRDILISGPLDRQQPLTSESNTSFVEAVRPVPELYEMSISELEALVTQVVHEDGFIQLVRAFQSANVV